MKKYMAAGMAVTVLAMLAGCGANDIGKDQATQIALEDAGFSESEVTRLYVSQDRDDGRSLYEVGFTGGGTEYDYEIDASDGSIISAEMDESMQNTAQADQQAQTDQQAQADQQTQNGQNGNSPQISQEEASRLALERVPGASEQDLKIELDYDDGYYKYEGDIIYDQKEYEFEIDADTGTFLEWSEERR